MFNAPAGSPSQDPEGARALQPAAKSQDVAPAGPPMRAGARLRLAREAKGLTLEQVAAKLMLRADYVAALETMTVNLIPGKAYARAYLRSYVRFLELPEAEILAQYEGESARLREDAAEQIRDPLSKPNRERPWVWALMLALVGAGFIGLRAYTDANPREAAAPPEPTPSAAAAPAAPANPVARDGGEADPFALSAQVVEIEAVVPGWLEVRGPDGTIFMSRTMQAGERYRPEVGAGWTLHARDGANFMVRLNGAPVGALGEQGAPVLGRQVDRIAAAAVGEG